MGYEHKIIIIEENSFSKIAEYDLCCLGYAKNFNFQKIFQTPFKHELFINGEARIEDYYSEPLKSCSIDTLIDWLENYEQTEEHYRRIAPLLALLKGFNQDEWNNLQAVHFGY